MTDRARIVDVRVPSKADGLVLVLHGGASRQGSPMVSPTQLSVLRMVPIARRLAVAGRGRLAVCRLLNSTRGWDVSHTPAQDAAWALDRLRERLGRDLPVALVGHSLGGRAAILAAEQPDVRSVVALNPWVEPGDADGLDLSGRRVLVVHGDHDRIASPGRSAHVAETLRRTADAVGYVTVETGKHAMLRRGRTFDRVATDFVTATLLGRPARPPVSQVLAGEPLVEV